jgi:hypothetical protein
MRRRELLGIRLAGCIHGPTRPSAHAVVGVLEILGTADAEAKTRSEVFAQALQQSGWPVGGNLKQVVQIASNISSFNLIFFHAPTCPVRSPGARTHAGASSNSAGLDSSAPLS